MTVRIRFGEGFKTKILPNIKIFQKKKLHFQKCVTVRIGFGEGFEMKILPNIKIFHKNLYFQKRRAILEYELLTVGQDISQGRQQSANPEQSANQKRSFCRHLKTSSTTVHSTME